MGQKLHTDVLVDSVFFVVGLYLERLVNCSLIFRPFMDNWSIPVADRPVILETHSRSLQNRILSTSERLDRGIRVQVRPFQLLREDSARKRLIDGCAIIVSRAYLSKNHPKYSKQPTEILASRLGTRFQVYDMTDYEVSGLSSLLP